MEVTAMRHKILSTSVLVAALAATFAATASADGLPVLGIDVGSTGVASSSGAYRYVTIPAASRTIVERVAQRGGQILAWRSLRGVFTIPAVAYDGSAGGLSADGATLVLIEPRASFPRATTKLLLLSGDRLRARRLVTLQGDFSFDAIAPNGSWLYVIHYLSPTDPTRYRVQAFDVVRGRLLAKPIVDPREPGDKMRGNPLSRAMSADGRWAYTLYDGGGGPPFVHALDTVARSAHCIDLDGIAAGTNLWQLRLGIESDGKHLVVRDGATANVLIDLRTLSIARVKGGAAAGRARHATPPLLLGAGGAALLALAAGVITARRRRGQTSASGSDAPSCVDDLGDQ
jgi:hypothetical protein